MLTTLRCLAWLLPASALQVFPYSPAERFNHPPTSKSVSHVAIGRLNLCVYSLVEKKIDVSNRDSLVLGLLQEGLHRRQGERQLEHQPRSCRGVEDLATCIGGEVEESFSSVADGLQRR